MRRRFISRRKSSRARSSRICEGRSKERSKDGAPQFDFFHDFNGLPEGWKEDATASYYHDEGNWQNRMILGDSLLVMASLAEREALRGKVQCIYFDPPYGIRFNSNWQPSTKSRDVKEGKEASVSREPEVIRAFRDTWNDGSGMVITDFAQVVYENLKTAGVQNTKKGERLMLENLRPFASRSGFIQFEGRYMEKGASKRAAVCIGPEYDTVGYELVRRAAREAADLFDTLIVCGFAFAPEVDDTRLNFGNLTVLKARMNQDLRMADKLKATGAGNLFVVFGEPDIGIHDAEGRYASGGDPRHGHFRSDHGRGPLVRRQGFVE